jgi:hypothetical protein
MALKRQAGVPAGPVAGTGAAGAGAVGGAPARKRRRWPLFVVVLLLLIAGGAALYVWTTLAFSYSSGDRAGYVQKFSRRGWVCKTWEGELAMVNLPGTLPEIFRFTVRDEAVAKQVSQSIGQRVALHYEQHRGVPSECFGDTEFFVTEVRPAKP